MKIHSVKKEDRGTYFCVADNGVGKAAKRNVALEVREAAKKYVFNSRANAEEGGGVKGRSLRIFIFIF